MPGQIQVVLDSYDKSGLVMHLVRMQRSSNSDGAGVCSPENSNLHKVVYPSMLSAPDLLAVLRLPAVLRAKSCAVMGARAWMEVKRPLCLWKILLRTPRLRSCKLRLHSVKKV